MRVLPIWLGAKRAKGRKFTGLKQVRILHKKNKQDKHLAQKSRAQKPEWV